MSGRPPCNPQTLSWLLIQHSKSQSNSSSSSVATTAAAAAAAGASIRRHASNSLAAFHTSANSQCIINRSMRSSFSTSTLRSISNSSLAINSQCTTASPFSSRHMSTNNKSNNNKNDNRNGMISAETAALGKNKGPVSLKNTSRAQASAKILVKNALHLPHISCNNITKTLSTNLPETLQTSLNKNNPSQHDTTHFVMGGTHCDPAPAPYILAEYGEESVYTLVLLRHGESEWNQENRYTGWCDANLTEKGRQEARTAGRLLTENGIEIDHAFTSLLRRANFTTNMALNTSQQAWVPVTKSWRLNERHYGALQGYNKDTAYKELGIDQELVMAMRRSYDTRPPPMMDDHPHWHGQDRRLVTQ